MITTWATLLIATVMAWLVARWLTGVAGAYGMRRGIVSEVTERSSHTKPTSRLGGVGLAGGFAAGAAVYLLASRFTPLPLPAGPLAWIVAGWIAVFTVGLLDDLYNLNALLKLGLLVIACALPFIGELATNPENLNFQQIWWIGIAFGWTLFFVNAYNFMDGMDGFAGNFARTCGVCLMLASLILSHLDKQELNVFPLILAGAAAGFLRWNAPPARYFMGDGGSLSTGYLLSLFLITPQMTLPGLVILLPFVFDVVLTLIRRARRGENLLKAHRSHLYQRLLQTGLTHGQVLAINMKLFIACGVLGVVAAWIQHRLVLAGFVVLAIACMLIYWRYTLKREAHAQQ